MATETVPRIDPKSRPVDGDVGSRLINARPDRSYILANPNDQETGVQHYLDLGYEIERADPKNRDSVRIEGGSGVSDMGGAIVRRGSILMSCPKSEQDARDAQRSGWADHVERQIRSTPASKRLDDDMTVHTQTSQSTVRTS